MTNHPPLRLTCEADLLALVPYTFGFHPEDSLVVIVVCRDGRTFHARVDLPEALDELGSCVDAVVHSAVRNEGRDAHVIVYGQDECLADLVAAEVGEALTERGIDVPTAIRADGSRWFPLGAHRGPGSRVDAIPADGWPYDLSVHELTSHSVLQGRVTFASRTELAESLAVADMDLVERVHQAGLTLGPLPDDPGPLFVEAQWARHRLGRAVRDHTELSVADLARLLRAVGHPDVRDVLWFDVTRESAPALVAVWRRVVRCSPDTCVAPAAAVLAFAAWLSGDGALAWCAVDRALVADPDSRMAQLVAQALEAALPPSSWTPVDPQGLRLFAG